MANPIILWGIPASALCYGAEQGTLGIWIEGAGFPGTCDFPVAALDLGATYYLSGDGSATDLLKLLEAALEAAGVSGSPNFTVTADLDGLITIASSSTDVAVYMSEAFETNAEVFGLDEATHRPTASGGAPIPDSYALVRSAWGRWRPGIELKDGLLEERPVIGGGSRSISGLTRIVTLETELADRDLVFSLVEGARVRNDLATTDEVPRTFETAWFESISKGVPFRYCPDESDLTTFRTYRLRPDGLGTPWSRSDDYGILWDVRIPCVRVS